MLPAQSVKFIRSYSERFLQESEPSYVMHEDSVSAAVPQLTFGGNIGLYFIGRNKFWPRTFGIHAAAVESLLPIPRLAGFSSVSRRLSLKWQLCQNVPVRERLRPAGCPGNNTPLLSNLQMSLICLFWRVCRVEGSYCLNFVMPLRSVSFVHLFLVAICKPWLVWHTAVIATLAALSSMLRRGMCASGLFVKSVALSYSLQNMTKSKGLMQNFANILQILWPLCTIRS